MIKLYDYELSVNCYKQRLMMNILNVPFASVLIDFFPGWEHKGEAFAAINPLGHIPVIDDDGYILRDAHAILVYLATRYDPGGPWYPTREPKVLGEVASWLLFAEGTTNTASAARLHDTLDYPFDIDTVRAGAHRLFRVLDEHLWFHEQQGRDWVASSPHPTIADLALFPDIMLSEQGGISLVDYPALRRWTDRFKRVPGFSVMPGIYPATPDTSAHPAIVASGVSGRAVSIAKRGDPDSGNDVPVTLASEVAPARSPGPDPIVNEWFPVASGSEVTPGSIHAFMLLDERFVLLCGNDGKVLVTRDRCSHRGAQLSLGSFDGDRLQCVYHGWQFDTGGVCRFQPAHPDVTPPEIAGLRPVHARFAFDLWWVCIGDEPRNLPLYDAFDCYPGRTTICAPKRVLSSGPRVVENFLDIAHFPFVHGGYLGRVPETNVDDYDVSIVDGELLATNCLFFQPQPGPAGGGGGVVRYTYGVSHPYAARLVKIPSEADGGAREGFEIMLVVSPESECSNRAWMITTVYNPDADLSAFNAFGALIFDQDVDIVESQRPSLLPLAPTDEVHQRADRMSLTYRRWLLDRGIRYGTSLNTAERRNGTTVRLPNVSLS